MGKVARYLNQLIIGNVFDAPDVLEAYATDRSALRVKPKLVAVPESTEDVRKLVRFCHQLAIKDIKVPVTVRGSGLDETGADLGNGLIISTEKLNRLLEADKRERLVRVQAGITLKELNTALSVSGLTIPVAGHEMETIGGLISNRPADDMAGKYGGIMAYVERVEVVLANGDILQTMRLGKRAVRRKSNEKSLEAKIYDGTAKLLEKNAELIKRLLAQGSLGRAGYPTVTRVEHRGAIDLMPLFFGAQGTLGVITEVILRAVPMEKQVKRVAATFEDFTVAQKFLDMVSHMKPSKLNLYDFRIIKVAEETGKKLGKVTGRLKGGFVVLAEFDRKSGSALRKIGSVRKVLPKSTQLLIESSKNTAELDELSNSLVSFLNQTRSGERVPLVTDFSVPPAKLTGFVNDLRVLEKSLGLELALYGSYMASNYSLRPRFDIEADDFNKRATAFLRTGAYIISRRGGNLAGGTPEGRVKAIATNEEMPPDETALYAGIKGIFDKYEILNPGVKLGADAAYTIRHFRKK